MQKVCLLRAVLWPATGGEIKWPLLGASSRHSESSSFPWSFQFPCRQFVMIYVALPKALPPLECSIHFAEGPLRVNDLVVDVFDGQTGAALAAA